ncbi:pfs domain containing protein [Metarhizium rileyi]|uniref:Pfs domain containing protein n=1 Tax=Metarhizium rileyi (strain RCEF 4871) TaxID=1649241 RepID=A0A162JLM7_METRR|nr:pfs domain containing protein [Metarhizium rileyi RCEF 4871]
MPAGGSRPQTAKDLVDRLVDLGINSFDEPARKLPRAEKEASALRALSKSMIKVFRDEEQSSYVPEVLVVSTFIDLEAYKDLCTTLAKIIASGTADEKLLENKILAAFTSVLRLPQAECIQERLPVLGVIGTLQKRLEGACKTANFTDQYYLIRSLSEVLDRMNELKVRGISDADIIQPLLGIFDSARKHPDVRLSQAARYAYQALLGIPGDVGPWLKLAKTTANLIDGASKIAGGVTTGDPSKVINGISGLDLPRIVNSVIEGVKSASESTGAMEEIFSGIREMRKPARWYIALRYTGVLIQGNCKDILKAMLEAPNLGCLKNKDFLCGLCSQLEEARSAGPDRRLVVEMLTEFLAKQAKVSNYGRVRKWVHMVTDIDEALYPKKPVRRVWLPWSGSRKHDNNIGFLARPLEDLGYQSELLIKAWKRCHEAKLFYADQLIRNEYTSPELGLLKVERLDGSSLPMEQCYVNLAILKVYGENTSECKEKDYVESDRSNENGDEDGHSDRDASPNDNIKTRGSTKHHKHGNTVSPFTLEERLKVGDRQTLNTISLPDLFKKTDPSASDPGSYYRYTSFLILREPSCFRRNSRLLIQIKDKKPPDIKRVLIRGQAGVGKSTLCKKMVHEFIHHGMWSEVIDRIIWLPLRKLKGMQGSIEDVIGKEYFGASQDILFNALCNEIHQDSHRTLFILDGLDEVFHEVNNKNTLLLRLLGQPRVIITSRPYAINKEVIRNINLEVETVGFSPEQVKEYIAAIGKDKVDEIQHFSDGHRIIQGLARIPIQLDAICFSFTAQNIATQGNSLGKTISTMTELYQAVERALWNKDVEKLEMRHPDKLQPVTKIEAQEAGRKSVLALAKNNIDSLQDLAFSGLRESTVEFDKEYLGDIFTHEQNNAWSGDAVKLSFLRSSGGSATDRTYHFLHLTFQEYFAAQYFTKCWKSNELLRAPRSERQKTGHRNSGFVTPEAFVRREKYNPRYDIFWRFVTGLLQTNTSCEQHLCRFFGLVEKEPRDVFGPGHQRLIMHCLSELKPLQLGQSFGQVRASLETQLKEWLVYEYRITKGWQLGMEAEFPLSLLLACFRESSLEAKSAILRSIENRSHVPLEVTALIATILKPSAKDPLDDAEAVLRIHAFYIIRAHGVRLPDATLESVIDRLDSPQDWSQKEALGILKYQPIFSDTISEMLAKRFSALNINVKDAAYQDFTGKYSVALLGAMASQLQKADATIQSFVIEALTKIRYLPEPVLQILTTKLEGPEKVISTSVCEILRFQKEMSGDVLQVIVSHFNNSDEGTRSLAAEILISQSDTLQESQLQLFVGQLSNSKKFVRDSAADILRNVASSGQGLSPGVCKAIFKELESHGKETKNLAASILRTCKHVPERILSALVTHLKDQDKDLTGSIVTALRHQQDLPDTVLHDITKQVEDSAALIQELPLALLGRLSALPFSILQTLSKQLEDSDKTIRTRASHILAVQQTLPHSICRDVAMYLKRSNANAWEPALYILAHHSGIPESLVALIAEKMLNIGSDISGTIKRMAQKVVSKALVENIISERSRQYLGFCKLEWWIEYVLLHEKALPKAILHVVRARLGSHKAEEYSQIYGLEWLLPIPQSIMEMLATKLDGSHKVLREKLLLGLYAHALDLSSLPENVLGIIVKQLVFPHEPVRKLASSILQKYVDAPENIIKSVLQPSEASDMNARLEIVRGMGETSCLPESVLHMIIMQLEELDETGLNLAVDILIQHTEITKKYESAAPYALTEPMFQILIGLLDHSDGRVSEAASKVLTEQNLTEPILRTIVENHLPNAANPWTQKLVTSILANQSLPQAVLEVMSEILQAAGSETITRRRVIEVLRGSSFYNLKRHVYPKRGSKALPAVPEKLDRALPQPVFATVGKQLQSLDSDIRRDAAILLCCRSEFPIPVLEVIARNVEYLLGVENANVGEAIEQLPRLDGGLVAECLGKLGNESFNQVFTILARSSFRQHVVWYVDGKELCIDTSSGLRRVPFRQWRGKVEEAQRRMAAPTPVNWKRRWETVDGAGFCATMMHYLERCLYISPSIRNSA